MLRSRRVIELNLGVFIIPLHHDNRDDLPDEVPLFQQLLASVRRQLPADFYVGVQGVLGNVSTRRQRYSPSIFLGHKFRVSENAALTVSGGLDLNFGHDIDAYDDVHATRLVGGYGAANGLLQLTPTVALRVSGTIAQYEYFDHNHYSFNDTYRLVQGGVAMLVSISETADFSPYFSASAAGALDIYGADVRGDAQESSRADVGSML